MTDNVNGDLDDATGTYGIDRELMCVITCPACLGECVVEDDRGREFRCRMCKGQGDIEVDG